MGVSLRDQIEQEEPFSGAPPTENGISIPKSVRIGLLIVCAASLAVTFYVMDPTKLDLTHLIIFLLLGFALCLLPLEQYKLQIKRIGPVEFEQVLSAQAQEHAEDMHEVRQRIEAIDSVKRGRGSDQGDLISRDQKLQDLLKQFLSTNKIPFSPSRIARCETQQPNFRELGEYDKDEIRRALQAMVAKREIETVISKRGNTLYRAPD
jgi:hypothetical protein